jgi:hypothetical protein
MSDNGARTKLYVFVLVLNIIFPVFGYTFTTFESDPEDYEISLDMDTLNMAGINLIDGESHNMTYNGAWVYYTELNTTIRAHFQDDIRDPWITIIGDGIGLQKRGAVSIALDTWALAYTVSVKSWETNEWLKLISNSTIVRDYNEDYNWSRFILYDGTQIFVTSHESHQNITRAVYEDGHVNMTLGRTLEESSAFNFRRFVTWYMSIMVGSNSWGLPSMFSWVLRILGAMSVFAVVLLSRELIRL